MAESFSLQAANEDFKQAFVKSAHGLEIENIIGKGQFSSVYRAKVKDTNETVALKKVKIFDMLDEKARLDCMKEINLLQVRKLHMFNLTLKKYYVKVYLCYYFYLQYFSKRTNLLFDRLFKVNIFQICLPPCLIMIDMTLVSLLSL